MQIEFKHDGQPIVIEQEADSGTLTLHFALQDVDGSGRIQPIIIHLTENVEVVVPKPGVMPGLMDPANERAVTRVELMAGEVRALVWDHAAVETDTEPLVVTLINR